MSHAATEIVLREWIGLDATTIGPAALSRVIQGRMDALGVADPDAYATRVRDDAAERDRLVEDVIVAESWFFRDRQVFDFVADFAVTLAALPGRLPIRILCAPCASGEEPYSVAMALLDAGLSPAEFVVDAIDISRAALERARRGRYSPNAFRNADLMFRDRWFRMEGGTAVLDDAVRSCVRFAWANLLDETFAADRPRYDIIFCRNLLIYLSPEARARVERQIDRMLAHDGILVLGAAEPPIMKGDWIPAGTASVFALRRGVHLPSSTTPSPRTTASVRRPPASARAGGAASTGAPPATDRSGRTGGEAAASLPAILEEANALANAHRHLEALELCERHRTQLPPTPELFFLMGMLHQSLGDADRAEGCFHKTLYLDAGHDEALLALALLARQRGDARMAETYRQSAARVLARKEAT